MAIAFEPSARTALSRGPAPKRKARLKPVSYRQRKRASVWSDVTERAIESVNGVCPVNGSRCETKAVVGHHKRLRSQGGKDTLGNCLPCCRPCHREIHERPAWAVQNGFIEVRAA